MWSLNVVVKWKEPKLQQVQSLVIFFIHLPHSQYLYPLTNLVTEYIGAGNHKEICWNEKFAFEFPSSEWENLTHLKFKIMAEECLFEGGFVGETM